MTIPLPSFYFPLRGGDGYLYSQSILSKSVDTQYPLSGILVFYSLQIIGGHVGIPFILLTLYVAKGVKRHPMLVNFLATWVIYTTSFCILLYLGKQFTQEPSTSLCTAQASLVYGTAVLTPTAGLCFVLSLWFSLRALTQQKSIMSGHSSRHYLLISAPYFVFAGVVIFTALLGAFNPNLVSRSRYHFYCTLDSPVINAVPIMAALIILTIVIFEGLIAFKLYRMHRAFRAMNSNGGPPTHLIVRVGIFSIYSLLAIIACITIWQDTGAELPYIIQATLPTAAFIIFGTQKDLLEAWGIMSLWNFIRRKRKTDRLVEMKSRCPADGSQRD